MVFRSAPFSLDWADIGERLNLLHQPNVPQSILDHQRVGLKVRGDLWLLIFRMGLSVFFHQVRCCYTN